MVAERAIRARENKERLNAPHGTFLAHGCGEKADAWLELAISLEISDVYDARGGGIRIPDPLLPIRFWRVTKTHPDLIRACLLPMFKIQNLAENKADKRTEAG